MSKKSYLVIGLGRFGTSVATELFKLGHEVLAVDCNEENVNHVADNVTHAITCDARDEATLKSLGVRNFDCAIVGIGSDVASSVMTTVTLKELGVEQVICKANSQLHKTVLEKVGADRVVFPEREMAHKLAQGLSSANIFDFIELSENFGVAEIESPDSWIGKTIGSIDIRAKYGVNIIAVKEGSEVNVAPGAGYVLKKNSVLVLVGRYTDIEAVEKL
ncbi:MAG: TrkA family potassium uptake protein [Ruminococcaceae bacterium]|nr:TrkA family potassium uptake protein [Oscillospiraceae bacterium]